MGNELISYVKNVFELEKTKFELEQVLKNINRKYEPEILEYDEKNVMNKRAYSSNYSWLGAVVGFFVGAAIIVDIRVIILTTLLGWLIMHISFKSKEKNNISNAVENEKAYIERVNAENIASANEKNQLMAAARVKIEATLENTNAMLAKMYSYDYIHPKYRSFVAISSIYEYLDTKLCDSLEGAEGAYSKYEFFTRLDKISDKLDVIISSLEQIKENQFYLYEAINAARLQMTNISGAIIENTNRLDRIAVNTAVTAYTAQVMERNQYYGRNVNDGVIYEDRINMPDAIR